MPPKKSWLSLLKSAVNRYNNSVSKCQVVLNGRKYDKYESTLCKLEDKYDQLTQAWETYKYLGMVVLKYSLLYYICFRYSPHSIKCLQ